MAGLPERDLTGSRSGKALALSIAASHDGPRSARRAMLKRVLSSGCYRGPRLSRRKSTKGKHWRMAHEPSELRQNGGQHPHMMHRLIAATHHRCAAHWPLSPTAARKGRALVTGRLTPQGSDGPLPSPNGGIHRRLVMATKGKGNDKATLHRTSR